MAYERPLLLVSPHMTGARVRQAQLLLAGHNDWASKPHPIHTYYGRIDAEYGPATAGAARRAKYWLGYAPQYLNSEFGELIFNLLTGKSKLSAEYASRRQERIKETEMSVKMKALAIAEQKIGVQEAPFGSNCQEFGRWYGFNCVAWCAIFVSYCISTAWGKTWKYSYVPAISQDAVMGRNGMSVTYSPQPGDLVCYTWNGTVDAHVAFFHHWVDDSENQFVDLGGNTGATNLSNGGEVAKGTRDRSLVHRFVRLTL